MWLIVDARVERSPSTPMSRHDDRTLGDSTSRTPDLSTSNSRRHETSDVPPAHVVDGVMLDTQHGIAFQAHTCPRVVLHQWWSSEQDLGRSVEWIR